jgi:hypothetical protein
MIHEFALDPAIVNDWPTFKYIVDQCGVPHGRLISNFPKDWNDVARKICKFENAKRLCIVEKLKNDKFKSKMACSKRTYDEERKWIDNAFLQHNIKPFQAIIALENPENCKYVLIADEIGEETPLWKIKTGDKIPKTPEAIVKWVSGLLRFSKQVLYIDPHFDFIDKDGNENDRFFNTLKLLIENSFQENWPCRLELHLKHKRHRQENIEFWKKLFQDKVSPLLPKNFKMKVFAWKRKWVGDEMHGRYVLTELGGIHIDFGLDEGWKGVKTDVTLMAEALHEENWKDFQEETAAFKPEIIFEIEGIRE